MTEPRPEFLNQPAHLQKRDAQVQAQLRAEAQARGAVLGKEARRTDFIDRSIAELETHLRKKNLPDRAALKERLQFLRNERDRLLT